MDKLRDRSRGNTNREKEEVKDWNYGKRVALMNSFTFLENILISLVLLSCKFTFTIGTLAIIKDKLCSKKVFFVFPAVGYRKITRIPK